MRPRPRLLTPLGRAAAAAAIFAAVALLVLALWASGALGAAVRNLEW
jgi:hypothetical protein